MKFGIYESDSFKKDDPEVEILRERGVEFYESLEGMLMIQEDQIVEIEDLDELLTFCKEMDDGIIIDTTHSKPTIEIYNGYRE